MRQKLVNAFVCICEKKVGGRWTGTTTTRRGVHFTAADASGHTQFAQASLAETHKAC
ncbi:MAG: hypothetical protein ACKOVA_06965 [Novosphingobium sp.]